MRITRSLAYKWIEGEDAYQWQRGTEGKFPIESDVDDLYTADPGSSWTDIMLSRWGRFVIFRDQGVWPQAVQNMGKLAAAGRALSVTVQVAYGNKLNEEYFEQANKQSLERLVLLSDEPSTDGSDDWRLSDFNDTQFGKIFDSLGLPLSSRFDITQTTGSQTRLLARSGLQMLSGLIDYSLGLGQDLPKPGVPSGTIEAWDI